MDVGTQGRTIAYGTIATWEQWELLYLADKGQVTMQWRTMGTTWEVNCLEKEIEVPR